MATRTNLCTNPSVETNLTGWDAAGTATTITRSSTFAASGSFSIAGSNAGGVTNVRFGSVSVTPGETVSASVAMRASSSSNGEMNIQWFDSSGGFLSQAFTGFIALSTTTFTTLSLSATAPSGAASVRILCAGPSSGVTYYIDTLLIEKAASPGTYFDGSTVDTADLEYSWTGTAHASTSLAEEIFAGAATGGYLFSGSAAGVTPLSPPTGLTATPVSGSQMDLSWNANPDALAYDLERDGVVIVRQLATTSYSDTGLSPGVTYDYRVRSVKW